MVDVGGYRLHLNCQGTKPGLDSPTVVLEAGAGAYSFTWDQVQRELARYARVCSYDRPCLRWSERGPSPRAAPYVGKELDAPLTGAGVEPPYVLVGHSMGGLYARYYYPSQSLPYPMAPGTEETLKVLLVVSPQWFETSLEELYRRGKLRCVTSRTAAWATYP